LALLQNTVFSFSMKVCGQRQDAEDTMQEVLLKSVPNLAKFDSPRALLVWLYKVAKTRCLMSRRRSKFAPKEALSIEELMPNRRELEILQDHKDRTPESSLLRRENAKTLRRRHRGDHRAADRNDSRTIAPGSAVCAKGNCEAGAVWRSSQG